MSWRLVLLALLALSGGCGRDGNPSASAPGLVPLEDTASEPAQLLRAVPMVPLARPASQGFAAVQDRGDLVAYPARPVVRRDGAYTWHRADLSEAHALAAIGRGRLEITTPGGGRLGFAYERHVVHDSGDWTWVGRLEGPRGVGEALVTFGADATFGSIAQPEGEPLRLTTRGGQAWLVETDGEALSDIRNRATDPTGPDYLIPPRLADFATAGSTAAAASVPTLEGATSSGATVVDIILGYTAGFANGLGGTSQAMTRLNYLMEVTNQAYINSQVDARVRLVHAMQVDYPDNTSNNAALEELTGYKSGTGSTTPAAAFNALRAARDQYGADLVSLVRKFNDPENDGCGVAWLIGGGRNAIRTADAPFGYSIVSDGTDVGSDGKTYFCRDETMAHEFGHNMGSQHDVDNAKRDDGTLRYGAFDYSFGYSTDLNNGNFYTVMAYAAKDRSPRQTSYRVFSNPRTTYCGGFPCGTLQADNARSLSQTIPVVASFRGTLVPDTPPPQPLKTKDDVDGDGRSDLLLQNDGFQLAAYWIMSGAVPTRYSAAFAQPQGYTLVARGDFDGNGRLDLVWARESDRHLMMWLGDGTGFTQAAVRNYSSGWVVTGAGDIDGDGRSDLLLENPAAQSVAYWIMNGATPTRYSPAFVQAPGSTRTASGDFNGDGKLDLAFLLADRTVQLWHGDGSGFTASILGSVPVGWVSSGAGDRDGDGRDDLVFFHPQQRWVTFWLINGTAQQPFNSVFVFPVGYEFVTSGDYNGDRRLDLIWARASDRMLLQWQSTTTGFTSLQIRDYSAGWKVVGNVVESVPAVRSGVRGDVDGNLRSDLILDNASFDLTAYWIMNGAAVQRYSGTFSRPAGYVRVASGDLNGDGKLDMVWARAADRQLLLWQGDGLGFGSVPIRDYSPDWAVTGAGDIDGDGKSDLLLANAASGAIAYWVMNGAVPVRYSGVFAQPAGYSQVATGDFNGDGRLDIVWARTSDRTLLLWAGDGTGFTQQAIRDYSEGWAVTGAGDIDGDGKSDLLLTHAAAGATAYWIMNGAVPTRYSGVFAQPTGYTRAATGDYNGDGKLDLVWVRGSDRSVLMWLGDGNGFAQAAVGNHSPGWQIVDP